MTCGGQLTFDVPQALGGGFNTSDLPDFTNQSFLERWLFPRKDEPMRNNQFADGQAVAMLRVADRSSVAEFGL